MNNNNKEDSELKYQKLNDVFSVAIFGSARIKETENLYREVFDLAYQIGANHMTVVTGGGPGLMEAGNSGHKAGSSAEVKTTGLTINLPWENEGNPHLDIKKEFNKFSRRLDAFMEISNVMVVMPGGIGTALELFYSWQLLQVGHVINTPIILHGKMWNDLVSWIKKDLCGGGYVSPEDLDNVYTVDTNEEAMKLILEFKSQYDKGGKSAELKSSEFLI